MWGKGRVILRASPRGSVNHLTGRGEKIRTSGPCLPKAFSFSFHIVIYLFIYLFYNALCLLVSAGVFLGYTSMHH
jgi:hypothetical protein